MREQEIQNIVNDFLYGLSYNALCSKYHHKFSTIKKMLSENGVDLSSRTKKDYRTNKTLTSVEIDNICNEYLIYQRSLNFLAKKYGLSVYKVKDIIKKNEITIRASSSHKYSINENYFDTIGPNQAYILGFFAADGWVRARDNLMELALQERDREILEKIKKEMQIERPLRAKQSGNENHQNTIILAFSSKKIKDVFAEYGIVPNKTQTTIEIPQKIPKEFIPDFVRGYSDGDGHVSSVNNVWGITSARVELLTSISNWLEDGYNIPQPRFYYDNRKNGNWQMVYTGLNVVAEIYKILYYSETCMAMDRKSKDFQILVTKNTTSPRFSN